MNQNMEKRELEIAQYQNTVASLIFKARKNSVKMMYNRKYDVSKDAAFLGDTLNIINFQSIFKSYAKSVNITFKRALDRIYYRKLPTSALTEPIINLVALEPILIYFAETPKKNAQIGLAIINEVITRIKYLEKSKLAKAPIRHIIIIGEKNATPDVYKGMVNLPSYRFEYFTYEQLAYNPLEHSFVPPHRILSEEERKTLTKNNPTLNINELPTISYEDPVVRFIGAIPGNVIEIIRTNPDDSLVRKSIAYRLVTDLISIP